MQLLKLLYEAVAARDGSFCVCHQEPGKRSQLWRMTGTGMLAHEGSSVPHNPNRPPAARSTEGSAILDIAGLAAVTDNR